MKVEIIRYLKTLDLEKIILFGSYAYGAPDEDSDIDIYVVTKDDFIPESWSEKNDIHLKVAHKMQDMLQNYPIDLITHTKKMHQKFISLNSSFSRKVMKDGIVIYGCIPLTASC